MTVTASRVRLRRRLLELVGLVALTLLADHLAGRKPVDARALPLPPRRMTLAERLSSSGIRLARDIRGNELTRERISVKGS